MTVEIRTQQWAEMPQPQSLQHIHPDPDWRRAMWNLGYITHEWKEGEDDPPFPEFWYMVDGTLRTPFQVEIKEGRRKKWSSTHYLGHLMASPPHCLMNLLPFATGTDRMPLVAHYGPSLIERWVKRASTVMQRPHQTLIHASLDAEPIEVDTAVAWLRHLQLMK